MLFELKKRGVFTWTELNQMSIDDVDQYLIAMDVLARLEEEEKRDVADAEELAKYGGGLR